jgi:hypothetical protein
MLAHVCERDGEAALQQALADQREIRLAVAVSVKRNGAAQPYSKRRLILED